MTTETEKPACDHHWHETTNPLRSVAPAPGLDQAICCQCGVRAWVCIKRKKCKRLRFGARDVGKPHPKVTGVQLIGEKERERGR